MIAFILNLLVLGIIGTFAVMVIGIARIDRKFNRYCQSLYHCRDSICPPIPEEKPSEVIKVEEKVPEPEPEKPETVTVKDWVEKNIDYLMSFLDDTSKERFFIPNNKIGKANKKDIEQWLLNQFRVEYTQIREDGINITLCNPLL